MKRELLCPDCKIKARKQFPIDNPFPGEFVKFVDGKARNNYVCDDCGKLILHGNDLTCFTIYIDGQYRPWESDYFSEIVPVPQSIIRRLELQKKSR